MIIALMDIKLMGPSGDTHHKIDLIAHYQLSGCSYLQLVPQANSCHPSHYRLVPYIRIVTDGPSHLLSKYEAIQTIKYHNFTFLFTHTYIQILHKVDPFDPTADRTRTVANDILRLCATSPSHDNLIPSPVPRSRSYLSQYKAPLLSIIALIVLSYIYTAGFVSQ